MRIEFSLLLASQTFLIIGGFSFSGHNCGLSSPILSIRSTKDVENYLEMVKKNNGPLCANPIQLGTEEAIKLNAGLEALESDCNRTWLTAYIFHCITTLLAKWSAFDPWTPCSLSCGGGSKTRSRSCLGDSCPAGAEEVHLACNTLTCRKGFFF